MRTEITFFVPSYIVPHMEVANKHGEAAGKMP